MSEYQGVERRKESKDMLDIVVELKSLSIRFDNELGSANGSTEGSVKRHLRGMSEKIDKIYDVILGSIDHKGVSEKLNLIDVDLKGLDEEFKDHKEWDKWLFIFIGGGQLISVVVLIYNLIK
jgi:hypothetical protein